MNRETTVNSLIGTTVRAAAHALKLGSALALAAVLTACSGCNTRKGNLLPEEVGMHPLRPPHEPHFVHLSWAVRRLTRTQAKYIRLFYGSDVLATLEAM